MYINQMFEFTMVLEHKKFSKLLCKKIQYLAKSDDEYVDLYRAGRGIIVEYRDSQYKKRVRLIVTVREVLGRGIWGLDEFFRKLDKRIDKYFEHEYSLDDFSLSGLTLVTDINVKSRENVLAYLRVLQRIGRVKRFTETAYEYLDGVGSFCMEGNSNGISLQIYDLESRRKKLCMESPFYKKKWEYKAKEAESILSVVVQLIKSKAIRDYTDAADIRGQTAELIEKSQDVFLDTLTRIVPYGDFYKKDKAVEIIYNEIRNSNLRRQMVRLLELIPEKKSLYLAQKAMNCRNIEKVMDAFAKINLSPVTISKRQGMKHLKNIYDYFLEE